MRKSDNFRYELSKGTIIFLFVYYFVILLIGLVLSICIICNLPIGESRDQVIIKTIIASMSVSGMLCALQYTKRLYKACITHRIDECTSFCGHIGNIAYFLLRPFYSFAFIIIMIISLLSGIIVVVGNLDYVINEKFLYLCVILSSYIGYSIGHVLDKFEISSQEKIKGDKDNGESEYRAQKNYK